MEYNKELEESRKDYQRDLRDLSAEQLSGIIEQAVKLGLPGILPNSQVLESKVRIEAIEMVKQGSDIKEIKEYLLTNSNKLKF